MFSNDYDKRERPVQNEFEILDVMVGFAATQIIDLVWKINNNSFLISYVF